MRNVALAVVAVTEYVSVTTEPGSSDPVQVTPETEAEARFNKWLGEKAGKIEAKSNKLATDAKSAEKARLAAEAKIKEERAKAIAEKQAAAAAAAKEAEEAAAAEAAEAPAEGAAVAPAAE